MDMGGYGEFSTEKSGYGWIIRIWIRPNGVEWSGSQNFAPQRALSASTLLKFLKCNVAVFGVEYLENGDTFSNFCIFVISASSSICTLSFRQIEEVRPPTLVKF